MKRIIFSFFIFFHLHALAQRVQPPIIPDVDMSNYPTIFVQGPPWQHMRIFSKNLSKKELLSACKPFTSPTFEPEQAYGGCFFVSYPLQTCHFYWETGNIHSYTHGLKHCQGFDHPTFGLKDKKRPTFSTEGQLKQAWSLYTLEFRQSVQHNISLGLSFDQASSKTLQHAQLAAFAFHKKQGLPLSEEEALRTHWKQVR